MKRAFGFLLTLCLLLGCIAPAFAAAMEILEQPETQTVAEKGKVTFSFNVKGQKSITWIFINPETGEETTARNISKIFKGLKVVNPNSKKMTLKNVPAALHGWSLFARCKSNGAVAETDIVQILIEGMDLPAPSTTATAPVQISEPEAASEPEPAAEQEQAAEPVAEAEPAGEPEDDVERNQAEEQSMSDDQAEEDPVSAVVTITGKGTLLFAIDAKGNPTGDGAESMTFEDSAAFHVRPAGEGEVQYWLFGDLRVEPAEAVTGFTLRGVTADMTVSVKQKKVSAAAADLDYDHMCKITCSNCFFTFMTDGITYASEGEVPAGAKITVISAQGANLAKGYTINGESGQQPNKVTFTYVVEDDTSFAME